MEADNACAAIPNVASDPLRRPLATLGMGLAVVCLGRKGVEVEGGGARHHRITAGWRQSGGVGRCTSSRREVAGGMRGRLRREMG